MKRFFCKLIMFTVTISIITLAVNYLFIKMDKSNPNGTNKFDNIPNTLDVCNFGSSHGLYGFNYADVQRNGYTCFNFGLVSQSISYDYRLMQQYGNHIVEGTIVFIPISYFSLFGKDEEDYDDFESKNKRYYLILPPELIKHYDDDFDMVICKTTDQAIELYDTIEKMIDIKKNPTLFFMGKTSGIASSWIIDEIEKKTGWSRTKCT